MAEEVPYGEEDKTLPGKWQEMRTALADVVINWARIENSLAKLLDALLDKHPDTLGSVIYYAPGNTETRIKIVDDVVHFKVYGDYHAAAIMKCWQKIHLLLSRHKESRNKIIHGETLEHKILDDRRMMKRTYVRHDAPNAFGRDIKSAVRLVAGRISAAEFAKGARQLPGMSANDIQNAANTYGEFARTIDRFAWVIALVDGHGGNYNALRERVLQLAAHLRIEGLPIGDPIPPEPSVPPPPSDQ